MKTITTMEALQKHKDKADEHMFKASQIATEEVERLARIILQKCPFFNEFIMAMGAAFFTIDDKLECEEIWELGFSAGLKIQDVETCEKELNIAPDEVTLLGILIREWDEHLHMTGEPMRFTANGEKVTDW